MYTHRLPLPLRRVLWFGHDIDLDLRYPDRKRGDCIRSVIEDGCYTKLRWMVVTNPCWKKLIPEAPCSSAKIEKFLEGQGVRISQKQLAQYGDPRALQNHSESEIVMKEAVVYGHIHLLREMARDKDQRIKLVKFLGEYALARYENIETVRYLLELVPPGDYLQIRNLSRLTYFEELKEILVYITQTYTRNLGDLTYHRSIWLACAVGNTGFLKWIFGESCGVSIPFIFMKETNSLSSRYNELDFYAAALEQGRLDVMLILATHFPIPKETEYLRIIGEGAFWKSGIDVVEPIMKLIGRRWDIYAQFVLSGNTTVVRWMISQGYSYSVKTWAYSVTPGNIETLELIASIGLNEISGGVGYVAIIRNDTRVLQWIDKNWESLEEAGVVNRIWREIMTESMYERGRIRMLEWALRHGWTINDNIEKSDIEEELWRPW